MRLRKLSSFGWAVVLCALALCGLLVANAGSDVSENGMHPELVLYLGLVLVSARILAFKK